MDWIKIRKQHILNTTMTDRQVGALVIIQLLTAHLERIPTREEMIKQVHYKTLTSLQDYLNRHSTDLQHVLNKVLIDVQGVVNKRSMGAQRQRKYTEGKKKTESTDASSDEAEKIREDKRREDNTTTSSGLGFYQKNINIMPSPYEHEMAKDLIIQYTDEWFLKACQVAVEQDKRSLKYIEGILKNSKQRGGVSQTKETQADRVTRMIKEREENEKHARGS